MTCILHGKKHLCHFMTTWTPSLEIVEFSGHPLIGFVGYPSMDRANVWFCPTAPQLFLCQHGVYFAKANVITALKTVDFCWVFPILFRQTCWKRYSYLLIAPPEQNRTDRQVKSEFVTPISIIDSDRPRGFLKPRIAWIPENSVQRQRTWMTLRAIMLLER